jgi:hypothetical protein
VKCGVGGTTPSRTASTAFTRPTTPAAASRLPTFAFTEPSTHAPSPWPRGLLPAKARRIASTSIASPTGVPLPWVST